jgi:uncharacterized membrane protein YphA (DoxX/SURF4 family)
VKLKLNKIKGFSKYSPILLRTGIAIVFLWFGFSQIKNPAQWVSLLPVVTNLLPFSQITFIYFNGLFEIIFATLLLLGRFTRTSSLLLGIHLLAISYNLGYSHVAVRDFALSLATLSILLHGADEFCLDTLLAHKNHEHKENLNEEDIQEE